MKLKLFSVVIPLAILELLIPDARAQLTVNTLTTAGLNEPYSVVEDANNNIYIADSGNNRIVKIDINTQAQTIISGSTGISGAADGPAYAAQFNNPQGLLTTTLGGVSGLLVADTGNGLLRFVRLSDGYVTTLAGNTNAYLLSDNAVGTNANFRFPVGLAQDGNGNVYITDWNAIRVMNLSDPNHGVFSVAITNTTFNKPTAVALAGNPELWVADTGNNTIKLITLSTPTNGSLTTFMGGMSSRAPGTTDSQLGSSARFNGPCGLLWDSSLGLLISDTANDTIRLATNNPVYGATNYSVITFAGTSQSPGLLNGTATAAEFSSPCGLVQDGFQSYFLADMKNNAVRSIQYGARNFTPVATPTIGYVTIVTDPATGLATAVFNTDLPKVFNNDANIQIIDPDTNGTPAIQYTFGSTTASFPDPTQTNGTSLYPPYNNDGLPADVPPSIISSAQIVSNMTIKAIGISSISSDRRPPSSMAFGQFKFVTATIMNSSANVNDPQHIYLTNNTFNSTIYYTKDGSDPATNNNAILISYRNFNQPISVSDTDYDTNDSFTLRAIAMRAGYYNSAPFQQTFYKSNSLYSVNISFGFTGGEASSSFVASPGQTFYAPVTLTLTTNITIFSLQFNLSVTNHTPDAPPVAPGAYGFNSFLTKPTPKDPTLFEDIPPLMLATYATNTPSGFSTPPGSQTVVYDQTNFVSLTTYNTALNLISVGWLERAGQKNLYDTTAQTLITYSQDHDITFLSKNGQVVVGGYTFKVPGTASPGQTYQIQIGRPSATSDGIGAPGSAVVINAPTNGSYAGGSINSIKLVTVGQRKYVAGDVYPFQWFNAGDFGDGSLENADVEQVFEAAVYSLNTPPPGSDFFDAMDSCGTIGIVNGSGVYVNAGPYATNYPSTNNLAFTNYAFVYGYSNFVTFSNVIIYSNVVDLVNNTTNTYGTTNSFETNYTYVVSTSITPTPINFTYMDRYAGETTYTTNATDTYLVYTNTMLISNSVVASTDFYVSNSYTVLATNDYNSNSTASYTYNGPTNYSSTIFPSVSFPVANYNINNLFDGNDSTINTVVFGDGQLDVCDVYVTFRRSLDPSLTWFQRYWDNGQRVAVAVPNAVPQIVTKSGSAGPSGPVRPMDKINSTTPPQVSFSAGNIIGSAGQTVQIPISATIFGNYPLRVLMLNLTVEPLDGSPALTGAVQFTPALALGTPFATDSQGGGNYAAAWLDSTIAGLTGTANLGTLAVTIPTTASGNAAYAVHFDHASASPNGLASFPKQTLTGLITLSSRTNSSYGDGIPDAWRLRWFGTVNNLLSVSNACPSGDGVNNWMKYVAGVDPNLANDFPSVNPRTPAPAGATTAIHWPSVSGVQYVIERSPSLFSGSWTSIATNNGTGADMEYDDNYAGPVKFYRVLILP